jgi:hypothetical protein
VRSTHPETASQEVRSAPSYDVGAGQSRRRLSDGQVKEARGFELADLEFPVRTPWPAISSAGFVPGQVLSHRTMQLLGDPGINLEECGELAPTDHIDNDIGLGQDGGRAPPIAEKGNLA